MKHFLFLVLTGLSALLLVTPAMAEDNPDVQLFQAQEKLAMKGRPEAQYYLGEMYEQGLGTTQNLDSAFKWYKNSADQGNRLAKHKLARRDEIINQQARDIADEIAAEQARKQAKAAATGKGGADQVAAEQNAAEQAEKLHQATLSKRAKRQAAVRAMLQKMAAQPYHEPFE